MNKYVYTSPVAYNNIFVMEDGTVKGCGYNAQRQLGNGNTTNQLSIIDIAVVPVKYVASSSQSTIFIMKDGTAKGVGFNSQGQLGIGNTTTQSAIVNIPVTGVESVSSGSTHTMFLMNDGSVKGCGANSNGQLGIGNTTQQNSIIDIPITGVKGVICGASHTMFLMNDGTVKGCGINSNGQLGIGNIIDQFSIVDIPIAEVKDIVCGGNHTMFLMNDGSVKGCGINSNGQLGIGDTISPQSNIVNTLVSNVKGISCGGNHTMFLMNDGTVKGCGNNGSGELGIGNTVSPQSTIVNIPIAGVKDIICGSNHTMFLMNDGTVNGCGYGTYGVFGINNSATQSSIINIPINFLVLSKSFILKNDNIVYCIKNDKFNISTGLSIDTNILKKNGISISSNILTTSTTSYNVSLDKLPNNLFRGNIRLSDKINILSIDNLINCKCLLKDNNKFYTHANGVLSEVGLSEGDISKANVDTIGFDGSTLSQLTGLTISNPELTISHQDSNITNLDVTVNTSSFIPLENIHSEESTIEVFASSTANFEAVDVPPTPISVEYSIAEQNIVRYQLSKDGINWVGFDGHTWTESRLMTKPELETITSEHLKRYFGDSIYLNNLKIKTYFEKENESIEPLYLKSINVEYNENQGPVIIDPSITPDTIHAEFARLTARIVDYEGNDIQYRVLKYKEAIKSSDFDIIAPAAKSGFSIDNIKNETSSIYYVSDIKYDFINIFYKITTKKIPTKLYLKQANNSANTFRLFDIIASSDGITYDTIQADIVISHIMDTLYTFDIPIMDKNDYEYWGVRFKPYSNGYDAGLGYMSFDIKEEEYRTWSNVPSDGNIMLAYNKPYFDLGLNNITLEVKDTAGLKSEWTGNLTMTNQKPTFNYTHNAFGIAGTVNDPDIDKVSVQVSIDGVVVQPWTPYFSVPSAYSYEWDTKHTPINKVCAIKVEIKDTFDEITEYTFDITGKYKNFLFLNKDGEYFTSDKGDILQYLDLKDVIAGQDSVPEKVTLLNQTNNSIIDAKIEVNNGNLPSNAEVQISLTDNPFVPTERIEIPQVMSDGDSKDFYVRIHSEIGKGVLDGLFSISTTGRIVN